MSLTVLMYHATYRSDEELQAIDPADRPYAVHLDNFKEQLQAFVEAGYRVVSQAQVVKGLGHIEKPLLLTFDDGHRSNATQVAAVLNENAMSGLFFITTDFCRLRDDYCSIDDLKAMNQLGMALGTHGVSHRFLADLDAAQSRSEMKQSRHWLEDAIGEAVDTMSFPGGRYSKRELQLAQLEGYRWVHNSTFGLHHFQPHQAFNLIERIPVRQQHSAMDLVALINPHSVQFRRTRIMSASKTAIKKMIGNGAYDALYRRLAT